jgi:hypothetical protein
MELHRQAAACTGMDGGVMTQSTAQILALSLVLDE